MKKIKMSLVAAIAAAAATTGANAGALDSILSNPKLDLELRPRYEYVDASTANDAKAFTIRTALGAQFGLFGVNGLNAQIQGMSVDNFGLVTDYDPENTAYPKVLDGTQARVTQANISYAKNGFVGILGRKMVVLDNARFIGNVGWRQMPQTYDLAAGIYNYDKLSVLAAYVTQVNRIFNTDGDSLTSNKLSTGTVLLHATYKAMPALTLTAYDYMIQNFADHIGIRATGKINAGSVKLAYEAEYAKQNDPTLDDSNEPLVPGTLTMYTKQDADYYKLGLSATMSGFTVGAAYEVLGEASGDGQREFYTPLATLHAMNGWADVFATGTKDNLSGLTDASVKLAYNAGKFGKLVTVYHKFESDAGSTDYGTEIDAAYNFKINKNLGLLLKGAWFDADANGGYTDTTKYWVQLDYKFSAKL
ncbi:hypothetical protein [Hydrogenimonas thermophila]|uniref:Alginate export n=1 Tax=Hydrogenimonas thermophila TaxID=223786 RepID=A0A1I5Q4I7_9BACT|nr:hypothetical protein [Hydrogenimonas thermophila]SFP41258.1 hypothetical protein SAMN05216234_11836 [Hydrogenimonas thermophila]